MNRILKKFEFSKATKFLLENSESRKMIKSILLILFISFVVKHISGNEPESSLQLFVPIIILLFAKIKTILN